jgi:hypothetical protein
VIVAVTVGVVQGHMPRCRLETAKLGLLRQLPWSLTSYRTCCDSVVVAKSARTRCRTEPSRTRTGRRPPDGVPLERRMWSPAHASGELRLTRSRERG